MCRENLSLAGAALFAQNTRTRAISNDAGALSHVERRTCNFKSRLEAAIDEENKRNDRQAFSADDLWTDFPEFTLAATLNRCKPSPTKLYPILSQKFL